MAPPGLAPVAGARRNHERREGSIGQPCLDPEALVRLARRSPAIAAMGLGQSRLSRVVREFIAANLPSREFVGWVIAYADPTGETAVRNVMRERRGI